MPEPARRAAGRVPHRPADRRGGPVHRGPHRGRRPVLPVPAPLRGPHPAAGEAGPRPEVQGQGGAPAAPERPRVPPRGRAQARQVQDHPVYAAMVESLDQSVGRVMATLERLGARRPDGRDLHVRQRRPLDVGRLADLERPAPRGQGLALRRRGPRAPDRPVARGDEAGSRLPRAGDQHRLLPDAPRDDRTGAPARAAPRRRQPRAAAQGRHAPASVRSSGTTRTTATRGEPLRGGASGGPQADRVVRGRPGGAVRPPRRPGRARRPRRRSARGARPRSGRGSTTGEPP